MRAQLKLTGPQRNAMNTTLQKWFARTGIPSALIFFAGMLLMTFLPPVSPALDAEAVATLYREHATAIRAGAILIIISSMPAITFYAAISIQLRQLEGQARPIASIAQAIAGAANIQFFIFPGLLFVVASFRPERSPELLQTLNDLAFLVTILPWPITCVQALICGVAILAHSDRNPVFPRWVGFFNLWVAVLFLPGALIPFFKTGPFAWNGLLAFWVPATMFGAWFVVMQIMLGRAIEREVQH